MGQLGFVDPAYQSAFSSPSGGSSQISSGTGSSSSGPVANPITDSAYGQLLGLNQQNYGNVLGAYSQGQQQAGGQLPGIYGGYGQVGADVQNTLGMGQVLGQNGNWGIAGPAYDALNQAHIKAQGDITNDMTSRGLGNTTVGANLQEQEARGFRQGIAGLGANLASTAAGYQAQIGQAGLGARMQGLGMQTGLSGQEGGTLGSYRYANTAGALEGQASQATNKQTSTGGSFSGGGSNGGGGLGSNPANAYNQGGPTGNSGIIPAQDSSPVQIGAGAPGGPGGGSTMKGGGNEPSAASVASMVGQGMSPLGGGLGMLGAMGAYQQQAPNNSYMTGDQGGGPGNPGSFGASGAQPEDLSGAGGPLQQQAQAIGLDMSDPKNQGITNIAPGIGPKPPGNNWVPKVDLSGNYSQIKTMTGWTQITPP